MSTGSTPGLIHGGRVGTGEGHGGRSREDGEGRGRNGEQEDEAPLERHESLRTRGSSRGKYLSVLARTVQLQPHNRRTFLSFLSFSSTSSHRRLHRPLSPSPPTVLPLLTGLFLHPSHFPKELCDQNSNSPGVLPVDIHGSWAAPRFPLAPTHSIHPSNERLRRQSHPTAVLHPAASRSSASAHSSALFELSTRTRLARFSKSLRLVSVFFHFLAAITSMAPPFPHRCDAWTWSPDPDFIIAAANTSFIPPPVDNSQLPTLFIDGLWGQHEWTRFPQTYDSRFPYLAYIPIPPQRRMAALSTITAMSYTIMYAPVAKDMWTMLGAPPGRHVPDVGILSSLQRRLDVAVAVGRDLFPKVSSSPAFAHVVVPTVALNRARAAFITLESGLASWKDFVERFRALQRALLELTAFSDWWTDAEGATSQPAYVPPIRGPARGVFVQNVALYAESALANLATYIVVHKDEFAVPSESWVPAALHSARVQTEVPFTAPTHPSHAKHDKPLWYFLPHPVRAEDFEAAARGYAPRQDVLCPTPAYQDRLGRLANRQLATSSRRVSGDEGRHDELRRYLNMADFPTYMQNAVPLYINALNHTDHRCLLKSDSPREFPFPPLHLFWGPSPPTQRLFYLRAQQLLHEMRGRVDRGMHGLTTREWREVLNDAYWKRQWPTAGPRFNPAVDPPFDAHRFFAYGGIGFFGSLVVPVAAGEHNPVAPLDCGCLADLSTFDDFQQRYVLLHRLSLLTIESDILKLCIKTVEGGESVVPHEPVLRQYIQKLLSHNPVEWVYGWEEVDWQRRAEWLRHLLAIVQHFPGFGDVVWRDCTTSTLLALDFKQMGGVSEPEKYYQRIEQQILTFYIQAFPKHLGYYPVPFFPTPEYLTITCAAHRGDIA
ncbi:hypothetical protein BV25DRAFT_1838950 [Artomyces pyxidatus]|uniref:Uncharacterized protein n=1 Tax=Artomyces pyxidatus TaxID=48021 RepID=A0ACB8SZ56_9AGAM|nr:hypothetical protein BV25DRAFT_1838950 [Artomyces pyxidatus]